MIDDRNPGDPRWEDINWTDISRKGMVRHGEYWGIQLAFHVLRGYIEVRWPRYERFTFLPLMFDTIQMWVHARNERAENQRMARLIERMMPIHISPLEFASHMSGLHLEGKVYDANLGGDGIRDVGRPWTLHSPPSSWEKK